MHRHPAAAIGKDPAGNVWVAINHHPDGPAKARERARTAGVEVVSRSGSPFVRLDWIRAEFSFAIEEASGKMDVRKVIDLTHRRDIGLPVFERQAPDAPATD